MNILGKNSTGYGILEEYDAGYVAPSDNLNFITEVKTMMESGVQLKKDGFNFKRPTVTAVMQKYGVENKNGRIYPENILKREVEAYNKLISMGASAGETDHPESAVISINNVSFRVIKLWWQGRTLMGELYLPITRAFIEKGGLYHPADKIAHDIMHGFQYGVSSRGVGSVESVGGKNIVQEDFELICWDFVTTPSTKGSWVSPNQSDLEQYIESSAPSEFELKSKDKSFEETEQEYFKKHSNKRNNNINDALSKFMKGFR